ncbi:MAG: hypothetical protein DRP45_10725, partial [Candidatus Zixiibacteriota bacterium]
KFRVVNLGFPKNANMSVHGIDLAVGYHGNQLRWYDDLLGGPALTTVPEEQLLRRGLLANPRFLNLVGIEYMIDPTGGLYPPEHFGKQPTSVIGNLGYGQLLHNPNAFPRVFLVDRYQVIEGDSVVNVAGTDTTRIRNVVIETLHGDTDLRQVVLLEESPDSELVPADSVMTDSAWIIDYQAERVVIKVETVQDRILVMTDTWFPSWTATVDGQPTRILRADAAFRAIEVPAGSKQVVFEYRSERYQTARLMTWLTVAYLMIVVTAGLFWGRWRRPEDDVTLDEESS